MEPPKNAKIIENATSIMWFDENGILCSVAKRGPKQTLEEAKRAIEEFKKITGGKKVCLLSDNTNSGPINKEMRDYAAEVIPEIVKAIAVISRSALGKMTAIILSSFVTFAGSMTPSGRMRTTFQHFPGTRILPCFACKKVL